MRIRYCILLLFALCSLSLSAQMGGVDWCDLLGSDFTDREVCEKCAAQQKAPDYYCDCHTGFQMYYGLDTIISDTTWLWTKVKDVRYTGISAFWFSDSPVKIEAFIQCVQVTPYMEAQVGANRIYTLDNSGIQKIINEANLGSAIDNFKIRFRVYPTKKGGSGRFIALRYGEGLRSTCDTEVFPVYFGIKYPLSYSENVYQLTPDRIPASPFFVQWRQEKGKPAVMSISVGECTVAPVVKDVQLIDSTKVYFPPAGLLQKAKDENKTLFFHCAHADDVYGTLMFVNPVRWETTRIDTSLCLGKGLDLLTNVFFEDTVYRDTAWVRDNICALTEYNLTVTQPEPQDTTVTLTADELRNYRFLGFRRFSAFGTYDVYHEKEGECTDLYHVNVVENVLSATEDANAVFTVAPTGAMAGQPIELSLTAAAQVTLTDLLGRTIYAATLYPGTHMITIDAAGNYFLQLRTNRAVYNQRLMVK